MPATRCSGSVGRLDFCCLKLLNYCIFLHGNLCRGGVPVISSWLALCVMLTVTQEQETKEKKKTVIIHLLTTFYTSIAWTVTTFLKSIVVSIAMAYSLE